MPTSASPQRWDIFCTVIDNFGDIGVCWRLARQLAAEHGGKVRLWVDDLDAFARLCPEVDPSRPAQICTGIDIRRWNTPFPDVEPAEVVIEAFACDLPETYMAAMAARTTPPRWINLEYMSAEPWVAGCHGLVSPHPRLPLTKYFFIPGFDRQSAGLLRETGLLERHAAFDAAHWWAHAGGVPPDDQLSISLFAYENPAVATLLEAWAGHEPGVVCLLPESRILNSVATALRQTLVAGDSIRRGALELRVRPFVRQEAYDDLLLACDLNFVRGEDSLVRAIWAGKPFIWHIYPQDDDAHLVKLDAFLDRYCAGLSATAETGLREFWHGWNAGNASAAQWHAFSAQLPEIAAHTRRWRDKLAQLPDLARTLAEFCATRL